jgi:hypothetical protein
MSGAPLGVIDTATTGPGTVAIQGWAFDPDSTAAITVNVTLDGVADGFVTANGAKTGLDAAFPGYGDNHDFTANLTGVTGGAHTVCIVGVNVGAGANSAPICRIVHLPTGSPMGVIDTVSSAAGAVTVTGWMFDPDTANAISVNATLDGAVVQTVVANGLKTGLNAVFPGYGDNHDYTVSLTGVTGGTHSVCVIGLNVYGGVNSAPICRTITVLSGAPLGVIDTAVAGPGTITLQGWAFDPDSTAAITVNITLDGQADGHVTADGLKTGLNAVFPGYGDNHDFTANLAGVTGGAHTVCIVGVDIGPGANSSPICRTLVAPS